MSLAALILLAGVVSFFLAQQEEARHDALHSIANQAASYIDEISRSPGEIAARISVGPGGTLELAALAAGEAYALTVYRSYVVAGDQWQRAVAGLPTLLPPWETPGREYNPSPRAQIGTLRPHPPPPD